MEIIRKSVLTDKIHKMDLEITESQLIEWQNGKNIAVVAPNLNKAEREFIISGITNDEWIEFFGE